MFEDIVYAHVKREGYPLTPNEMAANLQALADRIRIGDATCLGVTVVENYKDSVVLSQGFIGTNPHLDKPENGYHQRVEICNAGDQLPTLFGHFLSTVQITNEQDRSTNVVGFGFGGDYGNHVTIVDESDGDNNEEESE